MHPKFFSSLFSIALKGRMFILFILLFGIFRCQRPEELDLSPRVVLSPLGPHQFLTPQDSLKLRVRLTALDGFQNFRIQEVSTGVLVNFDQGDFPNQSVLDSIFQFPLINYEVRDTLIFEFLVIDQMSRTGTNALDVIIAKPVDSIYFRLGTPFDTLDSYVSAILWKSFGLAEAGMKSDSIDFGFDTLNKGWMIAAPADSVFSQIQVPQMKSWGFLNPTSLFETNNTRNEFINLENDGPILESFDSVQTRIEDLMSGDVVGFYTVDTLAGWILIDNINDSIEEISVSIKVGR